MIDTSDYANCLSLYNFSQNSNPKNKESFSYIFNDNLNFLRFLFNSGKMRKISYDNIQKTIISHRCHSKFRTKCGAKETKHRAAHISSLAHDAHHHHIVFTIPKELRRDFIVDRNTPASVFNDLKYIKRNSNNKFYSPQNNSKNKYTYKNDKSKIIFGSILTLHTFGRDLKWNPHIHFLVCEEAFDSSKIK